MRFTKQKLNVILLLVGLVHKTLGELSQDDELIYLENFRAINEASYAAVDDKSIDVPTGILSECKKGFGAQAPFLENEAIIVAAGDADGTVNASAVKYICEENRLCIIPERMTLFMDDSLNLGALKVHGAIVWNDEVSPTNSYLCAGYVAIEDQGSLDMQLQTKSAWIYIKDNGASHPQLRSRALGSVGSNSMVNIEGRHMNRTWSLLSKPLMTGEWKMVLMHNPNFMGWQVGDRIAISPTKRLAEGFGAEFAIADIGDDGVVTLSKSAGDDFEAEFSPPIGNGRPMLKSAEVVNLTRNIVITGDDFSEVGCDPNLPEAVLGEETSVEGCRCSSFRSTCTVGLHTIHMRGSVARIKNTRVEKCGQRGETVRLLKTRFHNF